VLDPGRKKVKTGYFWALARDDRPWLGQAPPGVAFTYAPGRGGKYADDILQGFSGILQVDGYAGYNRLLKRVSQDVQLAYCWAHARRKLYDVAKASAAPLAQEGLKQIAALYRIEAEIKGQSADARLADRIERTKPKLDVFEKWLAQSRTRVSAKSPTGEALKYIAKYGKPKIMNSDQGSQFTGFEWTRALKDADVEISMDGKGRWVDNRMIERLWRSLKYECIYLNAFETGSQARAGIGKWLAYYNAERPHSTHGILTPDEAYERKVEPVRLAA